MANEVFLDTNGWIALLNASDSLHDPARIAWKQVGEAGQNVVFTDWVLAETGNGLARTAARKNFAASVESMLASPRARLIFVTAELLEEALTLYRNRNDKTWGLIDCASFVVMRRDRIGDALTNDRHYEQAGFRCLLIQS